MFHVQFTESVVALLKKIKKSNEKNVALLYEEIDLNEALIEKMQLSLGKQQNFQLDQARQSLKVNNTLRKLYHLFSDLSNDFPFAKNISAFSLNYAHDFYHDVNTDQLAKLIDLEGKNVYTNAYATIEKKLMGKLCKHDFKTAFYTGLKSGELLVEVYKFTEQDIYFIYYPSRNLFLFCDINLLKEVDTENNLSERERIVQELQFKNDKLKSNVSILKTSVSDEVLSLLETSYQKISDINFLNHLNNFDAQSNILKQMLKTDLF